MNDPPSRIHCSYHKCLTVYFGRVMDALLNRLQPWRAGYRHYDSDLEAFLGGYRRDRLSSLNNRALDLERLGSFRVSRFVRDPRDLVVSGYFYHRRGAEAWTRIEGPTAEEWEFANARVPEGMRGTGLSLAGYLESLPEEEGLLAEMELRAPHFESMAAWPAEHRDVAVWRYEEIVGDEERVFAELLAFHRLSAVERRIGVWLARRYSLARRGADAHVRDPASGQWRRHFTPRVRRAFDARWRALLRELGYGPAQE